MNCSQKTGVNLNVNDTFLIFMAQGLLTPNRVTRNLLSGSCYHSIENYYFNQSKVSSFVE